MSGDTTDPLAGQRNLVFGLLIVFAAAAWALLFWQTTDTGMQMSGISMGLAAPVFLAIWIVMMVAMMFPTAAPMILTFHRVQATKRLAGGTFVSTWIFVAAYLLVWTMAGVIAYLAAVAADALGQSVMWSQIAIARIGGAVLIVAGLYQFTPLKTVCLSHCQSPTAFIMTSWRDGVGGAFRMGIAHGLYCLGCCWLLFVVLLPLGIMNIAAMAALTLLIFAEKTFVWGRRAASIGATILIVYGAAVLAVPTALPTFMVEGETSSQPADITGMPSPAGADEMPGM